MPGYCPIFCLRRTLTDHDLGADERPAAAPGTRPGNSKRPPSPQTRDQCPSQCTAALHVERLVDGLVGDPHRIILGKIDSEPVSDLLRPPRTLPASLLAVPVPPTDPADIWSRHTGSVSGGDDAWRSDAVPVRSSMDIGRSAARSRESRSPERARSRSLLVRRTTDRAQTAGADCLTASRHCRGTTSFRPPATHRPTPRHPRSTTRARSPPRIASDAPAAPPVDDRATASEGVLQDQLVDAHLLPSQLLPFEMLRRPLEFTLGPPG